MNSFADTLLSILKRQNICGLYNQWHMLLICADFLMAQKWIADHEKFTDRRSKHAL